jgi:ABC-type Co2+ transport system permease subunit
MLLELKSILCIIVFGLIFSIISASITIYKFKNKNASKTSILSAILFLSMALFLPFIIG